MEYEAAIRQKVQELSQIMKEEGLWKRREPDWVNNYSRSAALMTVDFFEWLQFVYLPNLLQETGAHRTSASEQTIAPQAVKFFGEKARKGKLLQLLIELDSLS